MTSAPTRQEILRQIRASRRQLFLVRAARVLIGGARWLLRLGGVGKTQPQR